MISLSVYGTAQLVVQMDTYPHSAFSADIYDLRTQSAGGKNIFIAVLNLYQPKVNGREFSFPLQ